ncbi:MAG: hypothetical protein OQL06_05280 [Gammaproteobacteria bacterium]|nr:hypothetical protein [Gammaproteobacteria bacterium]
MRKKQFLILIVSVITLQIGANYYTYSYMKEELKEIITLTDISGNSAENTLTFANTYSKTETCIAQDFSVSLNDIDQLMQSRLEDLHFSILQELEQSKKSQANHSIAQSELSEEQLTAQQLANQQATQIIDDLLISGILTRETRTQLHQSLSNLSAEQYSAAMDRLMTAVNEQKLDTQNLGLMY